MFEFSPARLRIFSSFIGPRFVFLSLLLGSILFSSFACAQSVKLQVFAPPSRPPSWLVNSHLVSGATFFVKWSTVEPVAGSYDFSSTDRRFAPWIAAGLKVNIISADSSLATPVTHTYVVNSQVHLIAPTTATKGAQTYTFQSWSDHGAADHTITAPGTATTYTATYRKR